MKNRVRGFTLVEMVAVMVLIGILAAIAVPRLMRDDSQDRAVAGQVLDSLRQAQRMAAAHNRDVCISVAARRINFTMSALAGTGVACSAVPTMPGSSSDALDVTLAAGSPQTFTPAGNFRFRPDGVVANNAGTPITARALSVMRGGRAIAAMTIQPDNGYVQVSYF